MNDEYVLFLRYDDKLLSLRNKWIEIIWSLFASEKNITRWKFLENLFTIINIVYARWSMIENNKRIIFARSSL